MDKRRGSIPLNRWEQDSLRASNYVPPSSQVELALRQLLRRKYPKAEAKVSIFVVPDEWKMSTVKVKAWAGRLLLLEEGFPMRSIDDITAVLDRLEYEFAAVEAEEDLRDDAP